jgi:membrane associated rhomboid family serine protease
MGLLDFWAVRLAIVCTVVFVLQTLVPPLTDSLSLVSADILVRPWILLTAIFAHGSVMHLIYNMFALLLFGSILENVIGGRRWLMLFFASGILANIAAAFFYPSSLGASGAIFGLLGALAVLRPRMVVWVTYVPLPMFIAVAVWAAGDLFGLFFPSDVANAAHLAGLAIGVLTGLVLRKRFGEPFLLKKRSRQELNEEEIRRWENKWLR